MGAENRDNRVNENDKSGKRKKRHDQNEAEPAAQQQPSKKRNRKEIAIFGNYRHYYGYRVILSLLYFVFSLICMLLAM